MNLPHLRITSEIIAQRSGLTNHILKQKLLLPLKLARELDIFQTGDAMRLKIQTYTYNLLQWRMKCYGLRRIFPMRLGK